MCDGILPSRLSFTSSFATFFKLPKAYAVNYLLAYKELGFIFSLQAYIYKLIIP